jgi:Flp pilus assembly protein TadD
MKTRTVLSLGLSAMVLGGTMVGCTQHGDIASASTLAAASGEQQASIEADKARNALDNGKGARAVPFAEAAVTLQPQDAGYRMLLASAYLKAGRFDSARQAFADVLSLDPKNAKAALNLGLAQIGSGKWSDAVKTLGEHRDVIPASDLGLALALAGDTNDALAVLVPAVRTEGADAKTRQNLALTLALSGDWQDARTMAAVDLSPADVDKRLEQWAALAHPKNQSDQVAAVLGVVPASDPGQPQALALNAPVDIAAPTAAPVETAAVAAPVPAATPVAAPIADVAPAPVAVAAAAPQIHFADRHEVAQVLPVATPKVATDARAVAAVTRPVPVAPMAAPAPANFAKGNFFVQFGAYDNANVAHDAWGRATRRYAALGLHTPSGMNVTVKGKSFYRLSVGGFARPDADRLCSGYRAHGGTCFVRGGAGDQTVAWAGKGKAVQLASR